MQGTEENPIPFKLSPMPDDDATPRVVPHPEDADVLKQALLTDPTRADDWEGRVAARRLAKYALTAQTIAEMPEDSFRTEEERFAAASKIAELMTGQKDYDGRLWNGGKGFKTGAEYLRSVKEVLSRGTQAAMDPDLQAWMLMSDEEKDAKIEADREFLSHLGEAAGDVGTGLGELVRGVPRLSKEEYESAPKDVREASDWMGSAVFGDMPEKERAAYEAKVSDWRGSDWQKLKRRSEYEAKLRRKNALIYLPDMIRSLKTDEAKELAGELAQNPSEIPANWTARLKQLPTRDIETLAQIRGMTREHVEGGFFNWLGDTAIGVYNGAHGLLSGMGAQEAKAAAMAMGWDPDRVNDMIRRKHALWSAYAGWSAPKEQISDDHGALANFTIGLASAVPFIASMKLKALGFMACATEMMAEADAKAAAEGIDVTNPAYCARNALMGGLYAYMLKAVSPKFFGATANGAAEEMALRTAFLKGVLSGCAKLDTAKVMSQRTAAGAFMMAMQQGIAAVNEDLNLGGDAWRDASQRFTETFVSSIPDMLAFSAHGVLEGHARASGGWRKMFGAEGRANRSQNLREAVENAFAVKTAVNGQRGIEERRTATLLAQIGAMRRAWTEGGEKGLARLGLKPEEISEAKDYFEAERRRLGAAEKLRDLEEATDAESLEEIGEDAPLEERNAAADRYRAAETERDAAEATLIKRILENTRDETGTIRDLASVRNVWAAGHGVGAGKDDGVDAGAAALERAGFSPGDAAALSKAFGAERRAIYSPAASEALRGLYTRSTRGQAEATAALAAAFGGRVRTVEGRTYLDFPMPDGGTGTLAVETADLSQKFYGETGNNPEMARQIERAVAQKGGHVTSDDWIKMDDAARRNVVEIYHLIDEGDFDVVDPADPSLHVSSGEAETVLGVIRIDPTADPGAGFHEAMHSFLRFCQETGFWDEADLKWLTDTYGAGTGSKNRLVGEDGKVTVAPEQLDEESAADGFRQYLAKRMAGSITEEPSAWRKLFSLLGRLRHLRERNAAVERIATNAEEALYDQLLAGRYAHIRDLKFSEPAAPKAETGGETAAPQTGAKPTEAVSPEKPKTPETPEKPVASVPPVPAVPSGERTVRFEALTPIHGKKVKGHYEIVPLGELLHSNKPGYPMELQQRNRKDNKGEEKTRDDHVKNFEAGYLLDDKKTDSGAMVVARRPGADGKPQLVVVSGNGRTMVLEELANRNLYDRYRNRMKEWAKENGVENAVADADNPVLVRVLDYLGGESLKEIARLSNKNGIQLMDEEETARADADLVRSLDLARLYVPNLDGSPNMAQGASDAFLSAFVHAIDDTSQMNSDGTFTEALRLRARRALLAIACGQGPRGRDTVKKLVEDTPGLERQKDVAAAIAPHVAAAEARPEYAVGPDVSRAFADYVEFRENREAGAKWGSLDEYLKQGDMLDPRSEIAESIMRLLDDPKGAPVLAETVRRLYAEAAKSEADGLLGAARTRAEIWRDAAKAAPETLNTKRFSIASTLATGRESDADYIDSRGVRRILRAVIGDAKYGRTKYAAKHCVDFGTATTGGFTLDEISRYEHDILTYGTKSFDKKLKRRTITWKSPEGVTFTVGTFIEGKGRQAREIVNTVHTDRTRRQTRRMVKEISAARDLLQGQDPRHQVSAVPAVTTEALKSSREPTPRIVSQDGGPAQGGGKRNSIAVTPEQDAAYADAVRRGDLETARRMEREVYERMGYSDDSSYQGTSAFNGAAPSRNAYFETKAARIEAARNGEMEDTATLGDYRDGIDINNLGFIVFDPRSERNADPKRREAIRNIRQVLDGGAKTITMYRSVPGDVKESQFRNGDWITPSRAYAEENARIHGWGDKYRVIEQEVSIEDVWWDGNDIAEWGFDDGKESVYKNTAFNRKLLGPTYDDNGNLIPLSKRFNDWKGDVRYSIAGRIGAENMGIGGMADAEAMEKAGAEREEIWRKTGWWRGRDSKWRVELPPIAIDEQKLKQLDINRNNYNFRKRKAQPEYHARLEDLIADKQLVAKLNAAYGTLPHISVVDDVGWALGRFHPETNSIDIHRHLTAAEMRSVLEHELQHFIQHKEGFTGGGDNTGGEYQNLTGEVEARNVQKRLAMTAEERAANPPWETEDVPQDRQIVRFSVAQTATPQFKRWFGDWEKDPANASKVVDEDGKPLVVWHGDMDPSFTVFDKGQVRRGTGFWFAKDQGEAASYALDAEPRAFYLDIRNPAREADLKGKLLDDYHANGGAGASWKAFIWDRHAAEFLRSRGYDGLEFEGKYIAFEPTQIKSATDNTGAFSPANQDIRYSISGGNALATAKLGEWKRDVDEESVRKSIADYIEKGAATGDIKLGSEGEKLQIAIAANQFYKAYSDKIVMLSDGRCAYFAPDPKNRERGLSNAESWALYCVHAVTHGGKLVKGKAWNERIWSPEKAESMLLIEKALKDERCRPIVNDNDPSRDRVMFIGEAADGSRMDVMTSLDEYGNINADLTEVTVVMGGGKVPSTDYSPLTRAVEVVALHQADGYSVSTARNISNPDDEIKRDPESFARKSIVSRMEEGSEDEKESALVAFVAERALRHGPKPNAIKTIGRIGLELGLKAVDTGRIIRKGEALAERVRGTVIEKAVKNGDVATAVALLARESDIDRAVDGVVAGAAEWGGKLTEAGKGRIKSILEREIEKTVRSFNAASLADVERDTGIDIVGEILDNHPDKFDPKPSKRPKDKDASGGEDGGEGGPGAGGGEGDGSAAPESDWDVAYRRRLRKEAEERVAKLIATAKERAEKVKKDREERDRLREERRRFAEEAAGRDAEREAEMGEDGGGADADVAGLDQKIKLATFADFKTKEEFAAFFRVWAEERYKKEHGASTLGKHEEKRLFPEFYRKAVVRELQDLADKLLPPKGARATVNRWLGEIEPGVKPDTLERISADVFAFINKNAIRESATVQIKKFRDGLKAFIKDPQFDDLKMDADRRVTGWVEESARYIRRVCNLSIRSINGEPSQLEKERARLEEILNRREKVYDDEGKNAADAPKFDMETRRALAKLKLLEKYGAMKQYMPGEIADLADEAMNWLRDEAAKLEDNWREARETEDQIRGALTAGIVGPNGQRYQRGEGVLAWFDGLFDSLNGMIRLRLQHLVRFADSKTQQRAKDAINRVVVMLGDGEVAFARHLQDDRAAFHKALAQIFATPDGKGVDRAALADWLNRMTEAIPKELSAKLSKQGYADHMTYGQMLQLLVSLEQRSYASAIKANKRDGQAALIRTFETVGPDGRRERVLTDKDILFIDWLRSFYEAKRGMLSAVTRRMVGLDIDSPDPLYCPVKMYMGDKARGMHVDSSQAWDPIGAVFTRRQPNVMRDFDESASILGQFFDRSVESAKLAAWGERGSIIRGVFTSASVQESIRRAFGGGELSKILKQLEETFNGGENIRKSPGEIAAADKAMNWMTYLSLGYNPLSAAKQTTSFTVWANALPGGFSDLWRYMTDVDMATIKHIRESDEYRVRYGNDIGSGQDVATKSINENPSENPFAAFFRKTSMGLLRKGDFLPGGWIAQGLFRDLYNRHLKEGMDADAADRLAMTETFNMLEETQQSGRTYNTSALAREHGRLGRLLVQFATSPLQQLQYEMQAAREVRDLMRYRPPTPDADYKQRLSDARGKLVRSAVINHVLLPAALHAVTSIYRLAMGYDPEWEQEGWHWTLLRDITLGQFSRVFFIGAISTVTWDALITGKPIRDVPALIPAEGVVKLLGNMGVTARDVATLNYDRIQKDFDRLLKSTSITRTPYDIGRLVTGKAYAEREELREKRRNQEARKK